MMVSKKFWNEIEGYEWKDVVKIQEERLKNQLRYLMSCSEFYQKKLRSANIDITRINRLEDLEKIPFTYKDEIRESLKQKLPFGFHLAARMENIIQIQATSGTTGTPTYIALTPSDVEAWNEMLARAYYAGGIFPGDIYFHAWSMSKGFVGGLPILQAFQYMNVAVIPMGAESGTERILRAIKDLKPTALGATPYLAVYLGESSERILGIPATNLSIRKLLVGGEPGGGVPSVRAQIENLWAGDERECMGGADLGVAFWGECEDKSGMHFMGHEFIIPEIINPETGEVLKIQEGQKGELVYTAIKREASPLLRFRMRDHVEVTGVDCRCGRKSYKIRCFGRTDDMLIIKGVNVFPSAVQFVLCFFRPNTTGAMQIIADFPGHTTQKPLKLQVEYSHKLIQPEIEKLKVDLESKIQEMLVFRPEVEMVPSDTIERPQASKVSLIKRTIK
jgi:phenylacetate-CoA ligase